MIKVELVHEMAKMPTKAIETDACYDVYAASITHYPGYIEYDLGLRVEIPQGYKLVIVPRSSIRNYDLTMCNAPAQIDPDYRGSIKVCFKPAAPNFTYFEKNPSIAPSSEPHLYDVGDRVAQIYLSKIEPLEFVKVDNIDLNTVRGEGGFGSTGTN